MPYYPSTQLYHNGQNPSRATVVTDGNVMITYGLGAGTIIKLADWLILAGGAEIHEAFTAFAPVELNQSPGPIAKKEVEATTYLECGCRSDGLLCDTHLYS